MRRDDHAEDLYRKAVRLLVGTGSIQNRLEMAAAEISLLRAEGMAGEIQQGHAAIIEKLRTSPKPNDHTATEIAQDIVEQFVLVRLHRGL